MSCSALNHFDLLYVLSYVRVPDSGTVFSSRSHKYDIDNQVRQKAATVQTNTIYNLSKIFFLLGPQLLLLFEEQ